MAENKPRQFRLNEETLAKIDELAKVWGPVRPLTRTDVIREAIDRIHAGEVGGKKSKKSR